MLIPDIFQKVVIAVIQPFGRDVFPL